MKNKKKIIIIGLSVLLLTLLVLKFHIEIKDIFVSSNISKSETQTEKSVKRKTSYIGRIKEAKKLIQNQDFALANIEIKKAIEEKPNLVEPYLILAEMHVQQENIAQLKNLIEKLREYFPNNSEADALEVKLHIAEGSFYKASAILSQENISPKLSFYKALLLGLQNNHKDAEKIMRDLEKLDINTKELEIDKNGVSDIDTEKRNSMISLELHKKIKEISIIYEEFEELSDGAQPHLLALISKSLSDNNEIHLAREFAETAIKEDTEYIDAWILKGYSEYLLQNYDKALLDLKKAYELDTIRAETHYFLALTLEKLGQNTEAALFFEKALENDFDFSSEIKWKLIDIFTKQKKYEQVVELYKEIIAENPNPEKFIPVVHEAIDVLRKPEIALEITEKLIEENKNDPLALNLYGWALISNKKLDQAKEILDEAFSLDETNPRTLLNLGLLAEKQQKITEAIDLYRQSYEAGKNNSTSPIANLAADRYNQLIEADKPEIQEETRKANSP